MSYTITVESSAEGHTVTTSGDVPAGSHVITGHSDDIQSNLGVMRNGPDGRPAQMAHSTQYREQ